MRRVLFFPLIIISIIGCSENTDSDNEITEKNLSAFKQRDSLLTDLQQKLQAERKDIARVVWAGDTRCNFFILRNKDWYYVVQNNYTGGIYLNDNVSANFSGTGNIEAEDLTSSSKLNLYMSGYYGSKQSALNYIKSKCGNDFIESY